MCYKKISIVVMIMSSITKVFGAEPSVFSPQQSHQAARDEKTIAAFFNLAKAAHASLDISDEKTVQACLTALKEWEDTLPRAADYLKGAQRIISTNHDSNVLEIMQLRELCISHLAKKYHAIKALCNQSTRNDIDIRTQLKHCCRFIEFFSHVTQQRDSRITTLHEPLQELMNTLRTNYTIASKSAFIPLLYKWGGMSKLSSALDARQEDITKLKDIINQYKDLYQGDDIEEHLEKMNTRLTQLRKENVGFGDRDNGKYFTWGTVLSHLDSLDSLVKQINDSFIGRKIYPEEWADLPTEFREVLSRASHLTRFIDTHEKETIPSLLLSAQQGMQAQLIHNPVSTLSQPTSALPNISISHTVKRVTSNVVQSLYTGIGLDQVHDKPHYLGPLSYHATSHHRKHIAETAQHRRQFVEEDLKRLNTLYDQLYAPGSVVNADPTLIQRIEQLEESLAERGVQKEDLDIELFENKAYINTLERLRQLENDLKTLKNQRNQQKQQRRLYVLGNVKSPADPLKDKERRDQFEEELKELRRQMGLYRHRVGIYRTILYYKNKLLTPDNTEQVKLEKDFFAGKDVGIEGSTVGTRDLTTASISRSDSSIVIFEHLEPDTGEGIGRDDEEPKSFLDHASATRRLSIVSGIEDKHAANNTAAVRKLVTTDRTSSSLPNLNRNTSYRRLEKIINQYSTTPAICQYILNDWREDYHSALAIWKRAHGPALSATAEFFSQIMPYTFERWLQYRSAIYQDKYKQCNALKAPIRQSLHRMETVGRITFHLPYDETITAKNTDLYQQSHLLCNKLLQSTTLTLYRENELPLRQDLPLDTLDLLHTYKMPSFVLNAFEYNKLLQEHENAVFLSRMQFINRTIPHVKSALWWAGLAGGLMLGYNSRQMYKAGGIPLLRTSCNDMLSSLRVSCSDILKSTVHPFTYQNIQTMFDRAPSHLACF